MASQTRVPETDPAFEFASLASALLIDASGKGNPTFDALANFVGLQVGDPRFFEVIGMIGSRSVALTDFIHNLDDDYLDQDMQESLIAGINRMAQIINPSYMGGAWKDVANNNLQLADIRLLRSFSRTARQYKPLRLFTEEERINLLTELDAALAEIKNDDHYPKWAINQLEEGIRRLRLMVQYFAFFGHDAVLDQLIKVQAETKSNFDLLQRMSDISQHKLVRTISVFSLVANLLLLPPKAAEGIGYYRTHIHELVQDVPKLLEGPPKQITHQPSGDPATPAAAPPPSPEPPLTGP